MKFAVIFMTGAGVAFAVISIKESGRDSVRPQRLHDVDARGARSREHGRNDRGANDHPYGSHQRQSPGQSSIWNVAAEQA